MDECDVIPPHQFGFRKSHSTTEQVHRVYQTIRQSFEEKKYCSAAFLDIQQAFDRVWHNGLLFKVKQTLPHSVFLLIKTYLSNRIYQVKCGSACSNFYKIEAGVPQGSVLGPILYNIFTSDLPTTRSITTATYADDIAYLASHDDPCRASTNLQEVLDKTHSWLNKWRIRASAQKSVHMTFSLRKGDCPPVRFGNDILPNTDNAKYLGFLLDRRLTWKLHIKQKRDALMFKYRSMNWLMGRNSTLSLDNKLLLYNSILKPIWLYGIQLWGVASPSNIQCIQRAQNAILRTIVKAPWFSRNDEIHEYLKTPTIKQEIESHKKLYSERLARHPNLLASKLLEPTDVVKRLKRSHVI